MNKLLIIQPNSWYLLVASAVLISLLIRIATSFWRSIEAKTQVNGKFWKIFKGIGFQDDKGETKAADYWIGCVIGIIEITAYSVLLVSQNPIYIGSWLVFKTAHSYRYAPGIERGYFNRYLLSNALVLVASYILARNMFS